MAVREVKPLSPSQWKWLMEDMKNGANERTDSIKQKTRRAYCKS